MLDYEFSAESLYADGTGMSSVKPVATYYAMSSEANDGDLDSMYREVQSAENALQFLDLYSAIENKNASDKIRMLRKIKANYGGNSSQLTRSVENYCNIQSLEAEAEAADVGGDVKSGVKDGEPGTTPEDKAKDAKVGKQKKNYFKIALNAIVKFFKNLWDWIKMIVKKVRDFFKSLFSKDVDKNKTKMMKIDYRKGFNPAALTKYVTSISHLASIVSMTHPNIEKMITAPADRTTVQIEKKLLEQFSYGNGVLSQSCNIPGIEKFKGETKGVDIDTLKKSINEKQKYINDLSEAFGKENVLSAKSVPFKVINSIYEIKFMSDKKEQRISDYLNFTQQWFTTYEKLFGTDLGNYHKEFEKGAENLLKSIDRAPETELAKKNNSYIEAFSSLLKTFGSLEKFIVKTSTTVQQLLINDFQADLDPEKKEDKNSEDK